MSLYETAQEMADELTGAVIIRSLTVGQSPLEGLDALVKDEDGDWHPDYVKAATDEFHKRNPATPATNDEIASAIYEAVKANLTGDLPL